MQAALRFYVDVLGFENAHWGTEDFTSISGDHAAIYLCRGGQGRGGAWIWIRVEDAQKRVFRGGWDLKSILAMARKP
jgi:hypothetical protein